MRKLRLLTHLKAGGEIIPSGSVISTAGLDTGALIQSGSAEWVDAPEPYAEESSLAPSPPPKRKRRPTPTPERDR